MGWREDINKLSNNKLVSILLGILDEIGSNNSSNNSGVTGDYIPITGTEKGKPITGDLDMSFGKAIIGRSTTDTNNKSFVTFLNTGIKLGYTYTSVSSVESTYLTLDRGNLVYTNSDVLSKGIIGDRKFYTSVTLTDEEDDKIYTQLGLIKKFFVPKTGEGASGEWSIVSASTKKLHTPISISLKGSITGTATFDGSSDVTINTSGGGSNVSDATATTKGIIKISGDLDGTADNPIIKNGAITNNKLANKSVSSDKLVDYSVGIRHLPAGATNQSFLRGDGVWTTIPTPVTYTAGTGISIDTSGVISNSSPNIAQTLSYSNGLLSISGGNSVNLPVGKVYSAGTGININSAGVISCSVVAKNQTLSIQGNSLTISGGNSVNLPVGKVYSAGTGININSAGVISCSVVAKNQTLSIQGNSLTISGGNSVNLPVKADQTISLGANGHINLSGTGGSVDITNKLEKGSSLVVKSIPMVESIDRNTGVTKLKDFGLTYVETTEDQRSLNSTISLYAPAYYEHSLGQNKTNIKYFKKSGLDLVNKLKIVTFDRKDNPSIKNKIGIIINNAPEEFASNERDAVDLYKTVFVLAKALQELSKDFNDLRKDFNELKLKLDGRA